MFPGTNWNCLEVVTPSLKALLSVVPFLVATDLFAEVEGIIPPEQEVRVFTQLESDDPDRSTISYPASYFAQYDPVTALDMLNRIPGVDTILSGNGGGGRGLGAGRSSILIDGKRIAGKANSGKDMLERIAAKQVDRFQIIRGTSADLDVRSAGPVVNVIMNEGLARSSISAELSTKIHQNGTVSPGGAISFGGQTGALDYLVNYTMEPHYDEQIRKEYSFNGDFTPKDTIVQIREREQTDHKITGNFGYQLDDSKLLQLNALFIENSSPDDIDRSITDFSTDPSQLTFEREARKSDRNKWEVGGTYQHTFADQSRFNAILVINDETDDWFYNRFELEPSTPVKSLYVGEEKRNRERIVRASHTVGLTANQDIELGVERAQTILNKSFRLGSARSGTPSARFGNLVPVSDVDSTVEEIRYEPFAIHNWQISSAATLESTLVAEFSEIEQQGTENGVPVGKAREFEFLKPKLDYRYEVSSSTQLRATLERHVSQLSFSSFSASNNNDLEKDINAGNPDLEQEKSWRYELNLEYRLPEDVGVLNSRLFYHDIEDVIDRVDASTDPSRPISAPGNIGDGKRYGAELDASLRLEAIELPDTRLTAVALVQDSEVVDPFLNETRRLRSHSRGRFSLGMRHDLPVWKLNYGADYTYHLPGNRQVDIDDIVDKQDGPNASIFIEKVAFEGVTVRLESFNLLDSANCYTGTRYQGATADGVVEELEEYCFTYGRTTAVRVKATF
ncbi:MAG: TonB-dependent receptor [Cellvibrionaceae bacterium]